MPKLSGTNSPRLFFIHVCIVGLLISGCSSTESSEDKPEPDSGAAAECADVDNDETGATEPVDAPEGTDVIEVVESGYTYTDAHEDASGDNVSFGAVITNHSELIARNVTAEVSGYVGENMIELPSTKIPFLLPYETFALGASYPHNWQADGARFDRIEVRFDVEEWWPTANDVFTLHQVIVSDIRASDLKPADYHGIEDADLFRFSAYSCAPDNTDAQAMVLYRDEDDMIVGGAVNTDVVQCDDKEAGFREFTVGPNDYCLYSIPGISMLLEDIEDAVNSPVSVEVFPLSVEQD